MWQFVEPCSRCSLKGWSYCADRCLCWTSYSRLMFGISVWNIYIYHIRYQWNLSRRSRMIRRTTTVKVKGHILTYLAASAAALQNRCRLWLRLLFCKLHWLVGSDPDFIKFWRLMRVWAFSFFWFLLYDMNKTTNHIHRSLKALCTIKPAFTDFKRWFFKNVSLSKKDTTLLLAFMKVKKNLFIIYRGCFFLHWIATQLNSMCWKTAF